MCVTYFAWLHPQLPDLPLLLLFNRDEVLGRCAPCREAVQGEALGLCSAVLSLWHPALAAPAAPEHLWRMYI